MDEGTRPLRLRAVSADEVADDARPTVTVTLTFERRRKRRLRVTLDDGTDAAVIVPAGLALTDGAWLRADDGRLVEVRAASEELSTARAAGSELARAAYHLGNRHVPVQIGDGWLSWAPDHVLDAMVAGLGVDVTRTRAHFEPESGAYGQGGHGHHHG